MNERQLEVLMQWMETMLEQHQQLEARVVAADLTISALMRHHPAPEQLLEELQSIDQSLLRNDPAHIETTDRIQDHLGRKIEVLEAIVQDREELTS